MANATVTSTIEGNAVKIVVKWENGGYIYEDEIVVEMKDHLPYITINGATILGARAAKNLQWLEHAMIELTKYETEKLFDHLQEELEQRKREIRQHFEIARTAGEKDHTFKDHDFSAPVSSIKQAKGYRAPEPSTPFDDPTLCATEAEEPVDRERCYNRLGHSWVWEGDSGAPSTQAGTVYCRNCGQHREAVITVGKFVSEGD